MLEKLIILCPSGVQNKKHLEKTHSGIPVPSFFCVFDGLFAFCFHMNLCETGTEIPLIKLQPGVGGLHLDLPLNTIRLKMAASPCK